MTSQAAPAKGSSFYAAMRILAPQQRDAMFEIYAFCRAVDDIADEGGSREWKLGALQAWRDDLAALFAGRAPEKLAALAAATRAFDLQQDDFLAVIDGMAMDAEGDIRAPDWQTLELYCDRVASAVGRLSVRVFGLRPEIGLPLAHHLGLALQLTNILRDVDEDAAIGRLYLPREALTAAGIAGDDPVAVVADSRIADACRTVADVARSHFASADVVMRAAPRGAVKAPRLMEVAYRSILERMMATGFAAPRQRMKPSKLRLLGAFLRYGFP